MKQKKKGFTLVELVIVIAVIAILAGVMIAVFANVVNKAEKSREEQEMKQAELQQKSDDIIQKLENADWLSWEDIETAIAEGLKGVESGASADEVSAKVEEVIKQYADSLGSGNTGVTEEQIKYIIENSLQGQLTATQVEAIVKKYQASSTVTLSASQINQIKEAASSGGLTAAQVQSIVKAISDGSVTSVKEAIEQATTGISTLTEEQVSSIVSSAMEKYVRNGVAGDYSWYEENKTAIAAGKEITLTVTQDNIKQLQALAGVTVDGVSLKNVTIAIKGDIDLSGSTWTPIGTGATFEGTIKGADAANPVTISGIKIDSSYNAAKNGYAITVDEKDGNADKYGVGFVASLGAGARLENLVLNVNFDVADTGADGVLVGGAVGYLCGGTVENVTVQGTVKNYYRAGGIVGGGYGDILNCTNKAAVASTGTKMAKTTYYIAGGIIGYIRVMETSAANTQTLTMKNCKSNGTVSSTNASLCGVYVGAWNVNTTGGVILVVSGNTDTASDSMKDISTLTTVIAGVDATYEK